MFFSLLGENVLFPCRFVRPNMMTSSECSGPTIQTTTGTTGRLPIMTLDAELSRLDQAIMSKLNEENI